MSVNDARAVDLTQVGRVPIRVQQIIMPAVVEPHAGGLNQDGCEVHLLVVDVANALAWRVPMSGKFAYNLFKALGDILQSADTSDTEG